MPRKRNDIDPEILKPISNARQVKLGDADAARPAGNSPYGST